VAFTESFTDWTRLEICWISLESWGDMDNRELVLAHENMGVTGMNQEYFNK